MIEVENMEFYWAIHGRKSFLFEKVVVEHPKTSLNAESTASLGINPSADVMWCDVLESLQIAIVHRICSEVESPTKSS